MSRQDLRSAPQRDRSLMLSVTNTKGSGAIRTHSQPHPIPPPRSHFPLHLQVLHLRPPRDSQDHRSLLPQPLGVQCYPPNEVLRVEHLHRLTSVSCAGVYPKFPLHLKTESISYTAEC